MAEPFGGLESFIISHKYEIYEPNKHMPSLVRAGSPLMNPLTVDLLIFYVQVEAYKIDDSYVLSSADIADILEKFYGFHKLGQVDIQELYLAKTVLIEKNDSVWGDRIIEPHHTEIDLLYNWDMYFCKIFNVIETVQLFHRDGLKEYLTKVITEGWLFIKQRNSKSLNYNKMRGQKNG